MKWAVVPGHPDYDVSDSGLVRTRGRLLTAHVNDDGYHRVVLLRPRRRAAFVHVLMLGAFVGPRPHGADACHANDIPSDNRLENLRWGSRQENVTDAQRNGRVLVGDRNPNALLTADDVVEIRQLESSTDLSQRQLAAMFGTSRRNVRNIIEGRHWRRVLLV